MGCACRLVYRLDKGQKKTNRCAHYYSITCFFARHGSVVGPTSRAIAALHATCRCHALARRGATAVILRTRINSCTSKTLPSTSSARVHNKFIRCHERTCNSRFAHVLHGQVLVRAAAWVAEVSVSALHTARRFALAEGFHLWQRAHRVTVLCFDRRGRAHLVAVLSTVRRADHIDDTCVTLDCQRLALANALLFLACDCDTVVGCACRLVCRLEKGQ